MLRNLIFCATIMSALCLSGCATAVKMSPLRTDAKMTKTDDALLLFSLHMEHPVKPDSPPEPVLIHLFAEPEGKRFICIIDDGARVDGVNGPYYLLRIPIPAGHYNLRAVLGRNGNLLVPGETFMPIIGDLSVEPRTVTYLGQVKGRTRERKEGEFRAGPQLPLINQAAQGWSGSTWEVSIVDAEEIDLPSFRKTFPALEEVKIVKQIMPPFDRHKAQLMWEKSGFLER